MSSLSLYSASIPNLDFWLSNLEHVLKKGEADAIARGIDPEVFLSSRLAPDMFNLIGQVRVATSLAKAFPFRVTAKEPPVYPDDQKSFDDLYALIARTRKDIGAFTRADIDGREDFAFTVKMGPKDRDFTAIRYLSGFTLPNVYFHITTAYNILRHNGVALGKADFFGGLS